MYFRLNFKKFFLRQKGILFYWTEAFIIAYNFDSKFHHPLYNLRQVRHRELKYLMPFILSQLML